MRAVLVSGKDWWKIELSLSSNAYYIYAPIDASHSYDQRFISVFPESRFKEEPHQAGSGRPRFGQSGSFTAKANGRF